METIKKLITDIRAASPDEIRRRLLELDAEQRALRKLLRIVSTAKKGGAPCK